MPRKKFLADKPSCPKGSPTLPPSLTIPRTNVSEKLVREFLRKVKSQFRNVYFLKQQLLGDVRINTKVTRTN